MTERLFTNARPADGRVADLAVRNGRFVGAQQLSGHAQTIDLGGLLAFPGLAFAAAATRAFLGDD